MSDVTITKHWYGGRARANIELRTIEARRWARVNIWGQEESVETIITVDAEHIEELIRLMEDAELVVDA